MDESLVKEVVSLLTDEAILVKTACKKIRDIDKRTGKMSAGEILATLNLAGCLTTKQIFCSCILLSVAYYNQVDNPFWFHILCILDCIFHKEQNLIWGVLRNRIQLHKQRLHDCYDFQKHKDIDFQTLRSTLLKNLPSSAVAFTGLPHKPVFVPLSFPEIFNQYKLYTVPQVGLPALKKAAPSNPLQFIQIPPLTAPIPLSFVYNYLDRPLDETTCILTILSKAVSEPLSQECTHYLAENSEAFQQILDQHRDERLNCVNETNLLPLCDLNPQIAYSFIHAFMQNTRLKSLYLRMLITMRLNPKRMLVVIQALAGGDVDQLTIQSSVLIRLLQYKDEVERNHMIEMYIGYLEQLPSKEISNELESFCIEFLDIPVVGQFMESVRIE